MDFALTPRCEEYREKLLAFMDEKVYPAEPEFERELEESGNPHKHTQVMEDLKAEARKRGLWNLFHPHKEWGPGLTNAEYAPLAEIMGRSFIAPEACNCNAPDTGNMEVLTMFGTPEQQDMWLRPLLEGRIRSAFAMTEPAVASSDATNISLRIERDGDHYVLNGVKWWTSNGLHPLTKILIVMGKTDPNAAPHQQQSQILVPIDTPGLTIKRNLKVFGFIDHEGHSETVFDNVRVPASNLIAGEGDGFFIAQARLGPGRIHHCMRSIGMAERAIELMCERVEGRVTFGRPLADQGVIREWIARSRIEIEQLRLLTLKAAWLMDTVGVRGAHTEIQAIKIAAPLTVQGILDRAMQAFGAMGLSQDTPLAAMFAGIRTLRLADGPDEVHLSALGKHEVKRQRERRESS